MVAGAFVLRQQGVETPYKPAYLEGAQKAPEILLERAGGQAIGNGRGLWPPNYSVVLTTLTQKGWTIFLFVLGPALFFFFGVDNKLRPLILAGHGVLTAAHTVTLAAWRRLAGWSGAR